VAPVEGTPAPASPVASPAAAGTGWRIAEERELDIDARYVTMSPDGAQLAGVSGEGLFCVWVTETLVSTCVEERLPIREETITWSPDGTAVAFALDAIIRLYESDIHVYEVQTGELKNLTDDGQEGDLLDAIDRDVPIDDVPAWSPDGQRIAFARSAWGADDAPGSTAIMVIDRAGGEPVELLTLDVEEPYAVWMPMQWLPDGTLLYSQIVRDLADPHNGVWRIGVDDGSSPLQLLPGDEAAEVPGPRISDVADDRAIVSSYWLMGRFGVDLERPLFWLVDVATGERTPLAAPGGEARIVDAGFSPDGGTALLVTASPEGARLMVLDVASGEIAPLDASPRETPFATGPPQWADNGTVLLQSPAGPLLLTLEPAG
jgi:Tol biopolymer transport system component